MSRIVCCIMLFSVWNGVGCSPLALPMVPRVDEEGQARYEEVWGNLQREAVGDADRQLLLDAMIVGQLHVMGVDRFEARSEKRIEAGGAAVMEIRFDRHNPPMDRFTLTFLDETGAEVRRETYLRHEVDESVKYLMGPHQLPDEPPLEELPPRLRDVRRIIQPLDITEDQTEVEK